jgi:hypothetical protein
MKVDLNIDFKVDKAKSNRTVCRVCLKPIPKGAVRVNCTEYSTFFGRIRAKTYRYCQAHGDHELQLVAGKLKALRKMLAAAK